MEGSFLIGSLQKMRKAALLQKRRKESASKSDDTVLNSIQCAEREYTQCVQVWVKPWSPGDFLNLAFALQTFYYPAK